MQYVIAVIVILIIAGLIIKLKGKDSKYEVYTLKDGKTEVKVPLFHRESNGVMTRPVPQDFLPPVEEMHEINSPAVLQRIDQVVPAAIQIGNIAANAGRLNAKNLYQVIMPAGAQLAKSKAMEGAFRGFGHGTEGIKFQANLVKVDNQVANIGNAVAGAMAVASVVVGQYYMSTINSSLGALSNGLNNVEDFQNNEFKSKVFALSTSLQRIAAFKEEILENEELRSDYRAKLNDFEQQCIELLGQASLMIGSITGRSVKDYKAYNRELINAYHWVDYLDCLFFILSEIANIRYALYRGGASKENCRALLPTYRKQVDDAHAKLTNWHDANIQRFNIDLNKMQIKRTGLDAAIHGIPGLFNQEHNYRKLDQGTVQLIAEQREAFDFSFLDETAELYEKDVQLFIDNGKVYYFPELEYAE